MLKILSLMIIALFLITACETQKQNIPSEPETTTEAELVNNTNSTNETEVIIVEAKPVIVFTPRNENLTMYVLDIEGNAIIFQYKNKAILVDAGSEIDSPKVLKAIRDLGIEKLDYIFATNTKPKNIGGMPYLILRTTPSNIVENGIPSTYKSYKEYKELYNETIIIKNDQVFNMGDFAIKVLIGYDDGYGFSPNLDDNSLIIKVTYGNANFLLMSDCSLDCEEKIKNDGVNAEVIKISNSCDATSLAFLQRVNPTWAIVSGKHDNFCPNVIDKFNNLNIPVFITQDKGNIFVTTDGLDFKIDWNKDG
mgnify:CR=1 FL=1